jgi:hypothetical protein
MKKKKKTFFKYICGLLLNISLKSYQIRDMYYQILMLLMLKSPSFVNQMQDFQLSNLQIKKYGSSHGYFSNQHPHGTQNKSNNKKQNGTVLFKKPIKRRCACLGFPKGYGLNNKSISSICQFDAF